MLSILIPVYNTLVSELVSRLVDEANFFKLPIEIRCYDDGSDKSFKDKNRVIRQFTNVTYTELPHNIGRAKIRNKLAQDAIFDTLLFLDADVIPTDNSFLMHYLPFVQQQKVVYGGICYVPQKPTKHTYLRWYYGNKRESEKATEREKKSHLAFKTANFLIHKELLTKLQFDENLTGYGHEDTLFAMQLKQQHIEVVHINNPVIHLGLDETKQYLKKIDESVSSLHHILQLSDKHPLIHHIKLIRYYNLINKWKLSGVLIALFTLFKPLITLQLQSKYANLFLFDCYKLGTLLVARK